MPDAEGVFDVGNHGEQPRALPGRHAQIFRLESEGKRQLLIAKMAVHHIVQAAPGGQVGDGADQVGMDERADAVAGSLQTGIQVVEALPLPAHHPGILVVMPGEHALDLGLHGGGVARGVERALLELQPVHRREAADGQLAVEIGPCVGERLGQHILEHQERGPGIEDIRPQPDLGIAPAEPVLCLEHGHPAPASGKNHGGRQTARAGTHDHDMLR